MAAQFVATESKLLDNHKRNGMEHQFNPLRPLRYADSHIMHGTQTTPGFACARNLFSVIFQRQRSPSEGNRDGQDDGEE